MKYVDLQQIGSQILLQQNGTIWVQQRIAIRDTLRNGKPPRENAEKQEKCFFIDLCKQRVHWRKLKVESLVTFHWLTCGSLPLAEL